MRQCVRGATAAKCWLSEFKVYGCKRETNHGSSNPVNDTLKKIWVYIRVYNACIHLSMIIKMCLITCHAFMRLWPPVSPKSGLNLAAAQKSSTAVWSSSWNDKVFLIPWMNTCPLKSSTKNWCCLLKSHILYMPRLESYVYAFIYIYIYIVFVKACSKVLFLVVSNALLAFV